MVKKILIGIGALIIVFIGVGLVLPSKVEVARETVIEAPVTDVFAVVNRLDRFNEWSPWFEYDPQGDYRVEGPEAGVGQRLVWSSEHDSVGSGSQEIIESVENELVRTALDFGDMGTATAAFTLQPEGEATRIAWSFESEMGVNPVGRYMGLMMDSWVGGDYERGLAKLKALVEEG